MSYDRVTQRYDLSLSMYTDCYTLHRNEQCFGFVFFSYFGLPQPETEVMKHQIFLQASQQNNCELDGPVWLTGDQHLLGGL